MLSNLVFRSETKSEDESEPSMVSDSHSDFDSELDPELILPSDPAPKRGGAGRKGRAGGEPPKVTAAVRKEARETIEALVELPVELWRQRDPTCANVAAEQSEAIVDAFLNLVVKRPAWLAALTDLGASGDWLRMVKALYPVVVIMMAHHVTRTVGQDEGAGDDLTGYAAPRLAV
jgi:hypothetical protein